MVSTINGRRLQHLRRAAHLSTNRLSRELNIDPKIILLAERKGYIDSQSISKIIIFLSEKIRLDPVDTLNYIADTNFPSYGKDLSPEKQKALLENYISSMPWPPKPWEEGENDC